MAKNSSTVIVRGFSDMDGKPIFKLPPDAPLLDAKYYGKSAVLVGPDGSVRIDWARCERMVAKSQNYQDEMHAAGLNVRQDVIVAVIMAVIAVRDGTALSIESID